MSASLIEKERQTYIDGGFDGWILKPIDFRRLGVLLSGIVEEHTRASCLYKPGDWERGGWFARQQPDVFTASTQPSTNAPVSITGPPSCPVQPLESSTDKERDRLNGLETSAMKSKSKPQESGQSDNVEDSVVKDTTLQP